MLSYTWGLERGSGAEAMGWGQRWVWGCPGDAGSRQPPSLLVVLLRVPISLLARRAFGSWPSTCTDTLTHFLLPTSPAGCGAALTNSS